MHQIPLEISIRLSLSFSIFDGFNDRQTFNHCPMQTIRCDIPFNSRIMSVGHTCPLVYHSAVTIPSTPISLSMSNVIGSSCQTISNTFSLSKNVNINVYKIFAINLHTHLNDRTETNDFRQAVSSDRNKLSGLHQRNIILVSGCKLMRLQHKVDCPGFTCL